MVTDEAREGLEVLIPGGSKQDHAAAYALIQSAIAAAYARGEADMQKRAAGVIEEHAVAWGTAYKSMTDTLTAAILNLEKTDV